MEIRKEHLACQKAAESAIEHAVRCGKLLIEAKAKMGHGQWLPWLKNACHLPGRTAQAYMRLAKNADSLPADMPVGVALKLVSKPKAKAAKPAQPKVSKSATVAHLPSKTFAKAQLYEAIADVIKAYGSDDALELISDTYKKLTGYPLEIRFQSGAA